VCGLLATEGQPVGSSDALPPFKMSTLTGTTAVVEETVSHCGFAAHRTREVLHSSTAV